MSIFKVAFPLVCAAVAWSAYSCSPDGGDTKQNGIGNAGTGTFDASMSSGGQFVVGAGGFDPVFQGTGAVRGTGGAGSISDACGAVSAEPEQITIYRDATVTDTIITYQPIAMFIMIDRSGSMVTGFPPPASPDSWNNSAAAISAFVNDPISAGIDVGLGTFPYGPANTASCGDGADCGQPVVPIGPLPQNAPAIVQAMQQQTPNNPIALTPTECGIRGMINECLRFKSTSPIGEECVAILVTDGTPTQCDTVQANLVNIVAQGMAQGVRTFTLGLPGSDAAFLDALAAAGGTNTALNSQNQATFIAALNNIRGRVVSTSSSTVTTTEIIETKLECQWGIPVPPDGTKFDKEKVNLAFTASNGGVTDFGYVKSAAECTAAAGAQAQAWYYDDENAPTQVFACPHSCDLIKNSTGARVDLQFGCERREPRFQ